MDIELIQERNALLMEGFKAFRDMVDALKDDRGLGHNDFDMAMDEPTYENVDEEENELPDPEEEAREMASEDEAFPIEPSFSAETIDPEDPAFWRGKTIGIPTAVMVRTHAGQDKLLPIVNGKFYLGGL